MSIQAIIADRIFDGEKFHRNSALVWNANEIRGICSVSDLGNDITIHHYPNCMVTPGFIDLQVNGGGGIMFNQNTDVDSVSKICAAHRRHGTAYLLPTLVSDTKQKMIEALYTIDSAISGGCTGVLGIHLEGPWFNPEKRGAHLEKFLCSPTLSELKHFPWLTDGSTLITLAPECVSSECLEWLKGRDIVISAGHSNAEAAQLVCAKRHISGFTHLFNAMSPLVSREPGVVGTALSMDESWCSIIVDGIHVDKENVLLAHRVKPEGKLFVVTDAMATIGSTASYFRLGDEIIYADGNKLVNQEGNLVGAHIGMDESLSNLLDWGIEEQEAIKMVSTYPAHAIQQESQIGYLKSGYKASATILDKHYKSQSVLVDGELFSSKTT
ncbi:N-acetylglucosamine-6-phosphate deacetylase [Vibrio sp. JC009]|uniref:N-acetylglucosamine-6-phosphate deacetylase n=1 Tax=Vibrio sp. JC009 TaxID=2912314 RepID=UPI0023AF9C8F|nr:N-acetylglucosamine-6-phosphate deacetylase [Vibrio sp. JC009]WED24938.1 N-acetylglucosamine-6-phosphate deacetylase [Vibrio sp. JC009]